jgi:hypothetical protein
VTTHPITLAAVRATVIRCQRLGLSAQRKRDAMVTAIRAMQDGASPARAYADACAVIRDCQANHGPRGAA